MKASDIVFVGLLLLSLNPSKSSGQTAKLRFEHLRTKDGLSNNTVSAILQDKKGYLWFGTYDGLNKYDGYTFTTYEYTPQDTTSLNQNSIFCLWEDKDGIIWIGTAGSGISKFDRNTGEFTHYQPDPGPNTFIPPLRAVSAINEDNEGFLWVGNWLGELRRFNKQTGKFFPQKYDLGYRQAKTKRQNNSGAFYVTSRDAIYCITKDRSGTLWVGTNTGLHHLHLQKGKAEQPSKATFTNYRHDPGNPTSLSHNAVTSIFEDRSGVLSVGTGGGLNRLEHKTRTFSHYRHDPYNPYSIRSNSIYKGSITEDAAGNLWIGTSNGLNKLNPERTQFIRYEFDPNDPESLINNLFVISLFVDKSGILWAGSFSDGVNKLDLYQKPFNLYRHNPADINSLSNDTVTTIYSNNPDIIWIGTLGGGLNAFKKKTGKFIHYRHDPGNPQSLSSNLVYGILEGNDGNFWIRCDNALSTFNPKTGKFVHYPYNKDAYQSLANELIMTMYVDRQGLVWLGTQHGIKSFDRETGKIIHYQHDPGNPRGLSDHVSNVIFEDKRGYLWVGHGSVGLSKLDKRTGIFTRYLPDPRDSTTLSTSVVYSIFEDSKGNLWFGTRGGGLCRFDPAKEIFTTYTKKHGLADNTIHSILEDMDGNLWLVTGKGISRFSPAAVTFTNYNSGDGLPGSISTLYLGFQNARFKGNDGTLYYGSFNGLVTFDPRQLKRNRYVPPVVITRFSLFDKLVPGKEEAKEITLNYNQNFFSFEFSALNYTNSLKNQYAYQLVGVNKDWVYSGTRRTASYTNIGPGEYTFRVKGSNNDGIWNEKGTSIRIVINPPWWRTWWAYTFYGLCFIAGVLAVHTYQKRRVIQRERERAREKELAQAREIEKAYNELKRTQTQLIQSEKMASLGALTAGIAHEIQNPLNFVNNFSEVNTELIEEMELEIDKGNAHEVKEIAGEIKENEQKINYHGKRADAIVKAMLQHSRASTGQKELTDINALTDEYLRLSYHGLRAKDKSFNATIRNNFDETAGKIEVVPQDIGRVLLNLFTNAFDAVSEKKKQLNGTFEPAVSVTTKRSGDKIEIRVTDNGTGIPQTAVEKIFQPFFTTKPTGQGTGLGLSLSYDIIKAHGGELKVETKEGEGAEFIIQLPVV